MFEQAFSEPGVIAQAGFGALIAATLSLRLHRVRIGLLLVGVLWAVAALLIHAWVFAGWAFVMAAVNAIQLLALWRFDRKVVLTAEETKLHDAAFFPMGRGHVRHLIDQGLWLDGQAEETLTEEGKPVTHLFYLAEGNAEVFAGGSRVGSCEAGSFIGEATVLSGEPATGTVVLTDVARFWCVPADTLRGYLRENPEVGTFVMASLARSLRHKLAAANRRIADC